MLSFVANAPGAKYIADLVDKSGKVQKVWYLPVFGADKVAAIEHQSPHEVLMKHADDCVHRFNLLDVDMFHDLVQIALKPGATRLVRNKAMCVKYLRKILRQHEKREICLVDDDEGLTLRPHIDSTPPKDEMDREPWTFFLAGRSGSGKTFTQAQIISEFDKGKKDNSVYIYAHTPGEDPSMRKAKRFFNRNPEKKRWNRINIRNPSDDDNIPLSLDDPEFEYGRTVILLDDVTSMTTSKRNAESRQKAELREALIQFSRECVETARHHQIMFLQSGHLWKSFNETRFLHSCRFHVFYPASNKRMVQK